MAGESGGDGLRSLVMWSPNDVVPSGNDRGLDAGLPALLRPELDSGGWCPDDCILQK